MTSPSSARCSSGSTRAEPATRVGGRPWRRLGARPNWTVVAGTATKDVLVKFQSDATGGASALRWRHWAGAGFDVFQGVGATANFEIVN